MSENNNKKERSEAQNKHNKLSRKDKSLANKELKLDTLREFYNRKKQIMVGYLKAIKYYGGYICIFAAMVNDERLSDGAFRLYCKIVTYVNPKHLQGLNEVEAQQGVAFPTRETLAKDLGKSDATIGRQLKELVELNYIVVKNSNNKINSQNYYYPNALVDIVLSKENTILKKKMKKEDKVQEEVVENENDFGIDPMEYQPHKNFIEQNPYDNYDEDFPF